mgnify:CR=1 FL=1
MRKIVIVLLLVFISSFLMKESNASEYLTYQKIEFDQNGAKLLESYSNGEYENYLPDLQEKFAEVSKEDVLKRVAALEFNHFLKYYQNSEDLNTKTDSRERSEIDN